MSIGISIGMMLGRGTGGGAVVLAAPANLALSVTGAGFDVITATWDAVAGAATYEVEYSDDGVTYAPVDTTALLTYGVTSADYVIGEVTHYIRVRAVGGSAWATADIPDLLLGLVTGWGLNQASGDEPNLIAGGAAAVQNGTPGSTTGLFGNARSFDGSNGFDVADSAAVSMGAGVRFTIVAWANPSSVGNLILAKRRPDPAFEYQFDTNAGALRLIVSSDGTTGALTSASGGTVATSAWQMVVGGYDGANIYTSINGGTKNTTAYSADVANTDSVLSIGIRDDIASIPGAMQQVLIWKRTLSDVNIATLYNGGAGLSFPFTP